MYPFERGIILIADESLTGAHFRDLGEKNYEFHHKYQFSKLKIHAVGFMSVTEFPYTHTGNPGIRVSF